MVTRRRRAARPSRLRCPYREPERQVAMNGLYEWLSHAGYRHPLHPPATHIPVGLVIGAFIFLLAGRIFKRESLGRTAKHCIILALMVAPVAALLGVMDWQHFYGGVLLAPIRVKLALAGVLVLLLLLAWKVSPKTDAARKRTIAVYALCLMTVSGLGFFGGELVYGPKATDTAIEDDLVRQGARLFAESCALCHYSDSTETKIGPGFKGLFQRPHLPFSQRPVSKTSIAGQLKKPFDRMPAFPDLTDEQVQSLVAYLKTL